ncbi:23S ribosomal RNA methyltransferase Erm [Cohnella zeiphila]|uniref:rRNA adenine N-6-methyltransferase n=1 Tax=Cohnella zeiphila TaxID=2761120 RepID=A0A7X0SRR3_9BACL|nr:23S ribosomal RNA methyltransferase Erm [Cohnella zeiphila]MBB6733889.1 23S ribosomal RNA methyltransferase Erm [Cohnella zeiphila]
MHQHDKNHRTIRKCLSGPNFSAQHLLHNPQTIKRLIETASLRPTDTVLDIGAGKGALTFPIAEQAARVLAVEADPAFAETLRAKAQGHPRIAVIQGDIREIRLPAKPFCVVANIPFSITTTILDRLLGAEGQSFRQGALILEKGAARRFTGSAARDPRLLTWRMHFTFELRTVVPRTHFAPPPRVDAAIVRIARRDCPLVPHREGKRFAAFARYVLREPRAPAADALKGIFTPAQLRPTLKHAKVERDQPVASWSPEQWAALFLAMLRHAASYRWPRR